MVNFDKIQDYLENVFITDEKAKDILDNVGITPAQVKVISTLIVSALRAYDAEVRN